MKFRIEKKSLNIIEYALYIFYIKKNIAIINDDQIALQHKRYFLSLLISLF